MIGTFTLSRALAASVAVAILAGLVPAGIALDRRVATALETRTRDDLAMAPRLLADRNAAIDDAMMMRAKEFASLDGLAEAMTLAATGDSAALLRAVSGVRGSMGAAIPLVVGRDGEVLMGPPPDADLVEATRRGDMPVKLCTDGRVIRNVALAPVKAGGRWVGAAGLATPLNEELAMALAGMARSEIVIVSAMSDSITATSLDTALARALHLSIRDAAVAPVRDVVVRGERYLAAVAPLADAGQALFVRRMADELSLLPALRRTAALSAAGALAIALLLGTWLARRVAAPVRQLAIAADAMREGTFDAPLPASRFREVSTVSRRFGEMRAALATRLAELRETATQLQDRNARLTTLQADLMQRERLAATGRLVAQLAHEIRNPVANLRNCLEVVHRRVQDDAEAREFVELAIDELLRMHELAEQMLDVNRPRDGAVGHCRPARVAQEVARLATAGVPRERVEVRVGGDSDAAAQMAPDAVKQVLLNLVQNAREAAQGAGRGALIDVQVTAREDGVQVTVSDNGPGIPPELRTRIFDPFFSTKSDVQGVGLGLFVAEGLVRGAGGRLEATVAPAGGAAFVLHLPAAAADVAAPSVRRNT